MKPDNEAQLRSARRRPIWASVLTFIASAYLALLILLALWAWYVDVTLLHSQREHLLPDVLLLIASLPTSLVVDHFLPVGLPPLASLAVLTLGAFAQGSLLLFLARRAGRSSDVTDGSGR